MTMCSDWSSASVGVVFTASSGWAFVLPGGSTAACRPLYQHRKVPHRPTGTHLRSDGPRSGHYSEALRRHPVRQPQIPDCLTGQNGLRLRLAGIIPAPQSAIPPNRDSPAVPPVRAADHPSPHFSHSDWLSRLSDGRRVGVLAAALSACGLRQNRLAVL